MRPSSLNEGSEIGDRHAVRPRGGRSRVASPNAGSRPASATRPVGPTRRTSGASRRDSTAALVTRARSGSVAGIETASASSRPAATIRRRSVGQYQNDRHRQQQPRPRMLTARRFMPWARASAGTAGTATGRRSRSETPARPASTLRDTVGISPQEHEHRGRPRRSERVGQDRQHRGARRIDVADRDEHQGTAGEQTAALKRGASRAANRYRTTMFQYDGKPVKKWSAVFALTRLKPKPLESSIAAADGSRPPVRHDAATPYGQRRHEHVGQEVHQVVERPAAEFRAAAPTRARAAPASRRWHRPRPAATDTGTPIDSRLRSPRSCARNASTNAAGGVEVHQPGGDDGRGHRHRSYSRRTTAGKSLHTGTPQKWEPSVHRGEMRPLRITHGGPICRPIAGCTARTCSISSIDAR